MKFHANENIEAEAVAFLRSSGHDVTYAAEIQPRASDEEVLERAAKEGRILITSDKGLLASEPPLKPSFFIVVTDKSIRQRPFPAKPTNP